MVRRCLCGSDTTQNRAGLVVAGKSIIKPLGAYPMNFHDTTQYSKLSS